MDRIDFYFDLHGHSGLKDFFIYGNAFKELDCQVQAQIFGKIIEYNCPYFENVNCIFSESAMKSKDKYDKLTKQGCGRVYFHKTYNIIQSYTVQLGFFFPTKLNRYPIRPKQLRIQQSKYIQTKDWQQISMNEYLPQNYMLLGKGILNSILDLFHLNPFTKMPKNTAYYIDNLRLMTAQRIYNDCERFHFSDDNLMRKMKNEPSLIQKKYYQKRFAYCGLSIIKKSLPHFALTRHQVPFIHSQRMIKEQLPPQNLIKSQILSSQNIQGKQKSTFQRMKPISSNPFTTAKRIEIESLKEAEQKEQFIIGRVHQQMFKQFAVFNKQKSRKRINTQISAKKITLNDFALKKQPRFHNIDSSLNLNSIKKQVLLHLLNKKKETARESSSNFKYNFKVINGKQALRSISLKKMQESSYKRSTRKLKTKL